MTRPAGLAYSSLEQPVPLAGATASFLAQRDLRSRSITVYGQTLARLAGYAGPDTPLAQLGPADLQAFMDTWYAGAAAATCNLNLAALRSFYRYALRQHLVVGDPSAAIERRRLRRDPDRRVIPARQLESLWHRADLAVRYKMLWRLLYDTAARADEILGLRYRRPRPAGQDRHRHRQGRDHPPGQLVHPHRPPAPPDNRRTDQGTAVPHQPPARPADRRPRPRPRHRPGTLVHRRAAECFTTTTGWTLHQLRHTRIRELKDDNCPLPVLQKITGHRSLRALTEHYPGPSASRGFPAVH
jgi:integrase